MTRMFPFVGKTWNPVVGCTHFCPYKCWAKQQAKRQKHNCELCYKFIPHFHEERLKKIPKADIVFVSDMGDCFCQDLIGDRGNVLIQGVKDEWVHRIIQAIEQHPDRQFLFQTKNPRRYLNFTFPENAILGTTIETNRDYYNCGYAPCREQRFKAMLKVKETKKNKLFISIEPIMDFDSETLLSWMKQLEPWSIAVGYDNYKSHLPEPPVDKTEQLINELEKFTKIWRKNLKEAEN